MTPAQQKKKLHRDAIDDFLRACSDKGVELVADRLVKMTDLARIVGCCDETVRRARRRGDLRAFQRKKKKARAPGGDPFLVKIEEAARWCFMVASRSPCISASEGPSAKPTL